MDTRYRIAPQLHEYDHLGQVWHPYLMTFHTPNHRSEVVNTDRHGFRFATRAGAGFAQEELEPDTPVSLLVGGSVAFGFGATSDAATLPSLLNDTGSGSTWLNFGGKAFSATQELLLFLFHHERFGRLERIVFLSGLNELVMALMGIRPREPYGPFFDYPAYDARMNRKRVSPARKLLDGILARERGPVRSDEKPDPARATEVYRRILGLWSLLGRALDVELVFVLQPMFNWTGKQPTAEERELFAALDGMASNTWTTIRDHFGPDQHDRYAGELAGLCEAAGIAFHDGNEAFRDPGLDGEWLYVDRVHATDGGNRVLAEFLRERGVV